MTAVFPHITATTIYVYRNLQSGKMQPRNAENANTEAGMHLVPDTYIIIHFVNVFMLQLWMSCTDYLINVLDSVHRDHPSLGILLCCDFNQLPESELRSYPLTQLVTTATRGTATLDKIFTNLKSWATKYELRSVGLSLEHVLSELHKKTFINRMVFADCY